MQSSPIPPDSNSTNSLEITNAFKTLKQQQVLEERKEFTEGEGSFRMMSGFQFRSGDGISSG